MDEQIRGRKIVHRANLSTLAPFLLVVALLAALGVGIDAGRATAETEQAESAKLRLSEIGNSGVSGTTDLRDVEGGVEVTMNVQGLPEEGVEHLNHFHAGGTCSEVENGENVPVTIPLDPIVANEDGTGSAITTIEGVTLSQLFDRSQDRIILVHDEAYEGEGIPPVIACADVNAPTSGERTIMMETAQPLPGSGGVPVGSVLLPTVALLAGAATLGYVLWRRR